MEELEEYKVIEEFEKEVSSKNFKRKRKGKGYVVDVSKKTFPKLKKEIHALYDSKLEKESKEKEEVREEVEKHGLIDHLNQKVLDTLLFIVFTIFFILFVGFLTFVIFVSTF